MKQAGGNQTEPLMTAPEVAELLKVKPNTVYQMRRRGILKAVDLKLKSVRFRREEVEKLMAK